MGIVIGLFVISVVLELIVPRLGAFRMVQRMTAVLLGVSLVLALFYAAAIVSTLALVFIGVFSLYRGVNILRGIKARMHQVYLHHVTFRTTMVLAAPSLAVYVVDRAVVYLAPSWLPILTVVSSTLLLVAVYLYIKIKQLCQIDHVPQKQIAHKDLPAVSLLIAARNETDSLEACLQAALVSDYPKLEIIVLDDCSQTTRTPEIIRSFAHDGVRFIPGEPPSDVWSPKNKAYDTLAAASSGDILLFVGVDIRLKPNSILELVRTMVNENYEMVSLLPRVMKRPERLAIVQPMRYVVELCLVPLLSRTPPVLSSCWAIRRQAYSRLGGLSAVRRMIVPETYFARQLDKSDEYIFLTMDAAARIDSQKEVPEQHDTAIRTSYPRLHRRPEHVAILSVLVILSLALPVCLLVMAMVQSRYVLTAIIAVTAFGIMYAAYAKLLSLAYGRADRRSLIALPISLLVYLGIVHYSMYKYEFSQVIWKGRNVCIPAMHVVARLPKA